MSWRLVSEVLTNTEDLPARERLILVTIAEEAREHSRVCTPGPSALAQKVGLTRRGLRRAMQRLGQRGLEVRVPLLVGSDGRPVYAVPGTLQSYRLPVLAEESPQVREGGTHGPPGGTAGPPGDPHVPPGDTSRVRQATPPGYGRRHPGGPPSPVPEPVTPPAGAELLAEVVVVALKAQDGPRPRLPVLVHECGRLVPYGWTSEHLDQAVRSHDWTGARPGAVIAWLRELDAPPPARQAAQERPAWCGRCDETTRTVEGPPKTPRGHPTVAACPDCHPSKRKDPAA